MPISLVKVFSEQQVREIVPGSYQALISITEPGRLINHAPGWGSVLKVQFLDSTYDEDEIRANWNMRRLHFAGCIRAVHATEILRFLEDAHKDLKISELLVHCWAGQSRSAAVARFAAERYGARLDRDTSRYNTTVYKLLQNPDCYEPLLAATEPASHGLFARCLSGIFGRATTK